MDDYADDTFPNIQYLTKEISPLEDCIAGVNNLKNREIALTTWFADRKKFCVKNSSGENEFYADSGSPIVKNNTLIGIASWLVGSDAVMSNIYTNVYAHKNWIQFEMNKISANYE